MTKKEKPKLSIYPVTIIRSRYGGVYEGGKWVAFNEEANSDYIREALSDDIACCSFFNMIDNPKIEVKNIFDKKIMVGKGDTPQDAYNNLLKKLNNETRKTSNKS